MLLRIIYRWSVTIIQPGLSLISPYPFGRIRPPRKHLLNQPKINHHKKRLGPFRKPAGQRFRASRWWIVGRNFVKLESWNLLVFRVGVAGLGIFD